MDAHQTSAVPTKDLLSVTPKTDRELLELAAKAAGLWDAKENCIDIPWSPLTDDGDAFRLAVTLNMGVKVNQPHRCQDPNCTVVLWEDDCARRMVVPHGGDKAAATRRAIVRAAAAIGAGQQ